MPKKLLFSIKSLNTLKQTIILSLLLIAFSSESFSQCPTVSNPAQSFCDIDDPTVADLVATDNGNGVRWFDTATSTTPLPDTTSLVDGEDYYADRPSGNCGIRNRVDVTIYGPPFGLNFQGVCVDDPNDATISDLTAFGNNVQWYNVPSGGSPLAPTTILIDNTIYYADQENPDTGCRTSRLSVLANIGIVPVPTGNPVQTFCSENPPTVANLNAAGADIWYNTESSVIPLDPSTLLIDGENYFATSIDPPCESNDRFEVIVIIDDPANSGSDSSVQICESEINTIISIDLIDELSGSPETTGTWTGPLPITNGSTGTVNITSMTSSGSPYVFTYTVDSGNSCSISSSTVSITISPDPNAGISSSIDICSNDTSIYDLFTILGGTPDPGGTWSPALASGTGLFDPAVDAPGVYTYTVAGTPPCPDASATVTVTIVPEPNAGTNGSIDICNNDNTQDLFGALGGSPDPGGTWSPALASGTGLFDPAVDAPGVYTYTVTGTAPCPDASATVTVTIVPEPNAGTNGSIDICANDTTVQDLFTLLGGSPDSGGTWSPALASGTGLFDPAVDAPGVYTYTVAGTPPCPDASATVTVAIVPEPNAGTNGSIDICNNDSTQDLFGALGGSPDPGGTWSPALASGTGLFDPAVDAPGVYTYTVAGTPPCPDASATVTVTIVPEPNAGTNGSIDICNNDNTQDLFGALGGSPDPGGTWSPALASGTGLFDPAVDAPGVYTYTVAGTPPCPDASATVTVTIVPEPNAGTNGSIDICANDTTVQDLFTLLGGSPDSGGTWSPALASGTGLFDPAVDAPGVYTYTVAGTPPCPDASATVTVAIVPEPNAGTNGSIDICNNDSTQDLFGALGGSPDPGGTWSPALASGTGLFDPAVDAPGVYTYTVAGTPPCPDASATVTVTIVPEPNAGTNGSIDICNNDNTQDLFGALGGSPDPGGTWSPALASGTGLFDPAVDAPGVYTYTVAGTPPCPDASATVTVTIVPEPNAGTNGSIDICNNDNTQDLFGALGGSPDPGGTWSPALASGTGLFDPAVDAPGVYTYTVTGTAPCPDASATVTVTIVPEPNAGTNGSIDICANDTTVQDLFTLLGGSPDSGGTWSPALASGTGLFDPAVDAPGVYTYTVAGTPPCPDASATVTVAIVPEPNAGTNGSIDICNNDSTQDLFGALGGSPDPGGTWSPALASGTGLFDPAVDAPGVYTYTVAGTPPCPDASATVTVTIVPEPNAGTNGSIDICNNDNTQDLFGALGGSPDPGGTWSPALASGTGLFDPAVDAPGVYTYTVTGTAPCPDASATVTVTIVPEPNAGTNGSIDICANDTTVQDLFTLLGGSPDSGGTWSPALASGTGLFDPAVDAPGVYTYTVAGTPPCPDASATVTVAIVPEPNAGTNGSIDICNNDSTQDLFGALGGSPDPGGTWSPALASGTGLFDPAVDAPGVYTYTVAGTPPCPDASATVTVTIVPEPNAGTNGSIDICNNDNTQDLFGALGGSPDPGGTWSPALASGTGLFDPAIDAPGVYTYTVAGASPCPDASATVTVAIVPEPNAGTNGSIDICNNDNTQDLFAALGGSPDSGGTWSPALASGTGLFDPAVDAPGVYTYTVTGTAPCPDAFATVTVTIVPEPNAGDDGFAVICSDDGPQNLFDFINSNPDAGGVWSPALTSGTGIFDPTVDIPGIYTYSVGPNQCGQIDSSEITVSIENNADASGLIIEIGDICLGLPNLVQLTGANFLPDGNYTVVYSLSNANNSQNTADIAFTAGNSDFIIPESLLTNVGTTSISIISLIPMNSMCSADITVISTEDFIVFDNVTPEIIDGGNVFCEQDIPTVSDLSSNILGNIPITWYDAPDNDNAYNDSTILINGETYYASTLTAEGCESIPRLEVTVVLNNCPNDIIIPDGFSPNGDGINDDFHIVNLRDRYPNFTLEIYNRYGNILYKGNTDTPNWNGYSEKGITFGNSEIPVGVYFYILKFNDGNRDPMQGRVYLSR